MQTVCVQVHSQATLSGGGAVLVVSPGSCWWSGMAELAAHSSCTWLHLLIFRLVWLVCWHGCHGKSRILCMPSELSSISVLPSCACSPRKSRWSYFWVLTRLHNEGTALAQRRHNAGLENTLIHNINWIQDPIVQQSIAQPNVLASMVINREGSSNVMPEFTRDHARTRSVSKGEVRPKLNWR